MVLVVNFKNYVFGKGSVSLAKECKKVDKNIILGVSIGDLFRVVKETGMKCFVQHVDNKEKGRNTGFILLESVKANNGKGVFLNHSEHNISFNDIKDLIKNCKRLKLESLVFVKSINEGKKVSKLNPTYICIEPPKLVGGKVSVSTANPKLIEDSVKIKGKILVGAGINKREDVCVAKEFKAYGIAVSSAVTKSKNPRKVLMELKW